MEIDKIVLEIEELKSKVNSYNKTKEIWIPLSIALIGLFGTIFGYFYTENAKNLIFDKKIEYEFISEAVNSELSGREKINKLMFLANSGLIPQNEKSILSKLNSVIITPNDELLFLDSDAGRIGSDNLYKLGMELNDVGNHYDSIKILNESIKSS